MRRIIRLIAIYVALTSPAFSERKVDIRGFFLGMSNHAFEGKLAELGCRDTSCKSDDGQFQFVFTRNLPERTLEKIKFDYASGSEPENMVAIVSEQYSLAPKPSDLKSEIRKAKEGELVLVPWLNTVVRSYDKAIAKWDLSSSRILILRLSAPGVPYKYSLELFDERLVAAEKAAAKRAAESEMEQKRAVNRAPRF